MGASSRPAVPRVLLVTDSRRLAPGASVAFRIDALAAQARAAFAAGVDAVQIREPDFPADALLTLTRTLAALGRAIVTERADIALAAGAAGVHLKGDGAGPARVRAILPAHMSLSRAVHDRAEAARYGADTALDWLLCGTAFATESKPGRAPLGTAGVHDLAQASRAPVIAIGGVTASNAASLIAAGAAGVAAIGIFLGGIAPEYVDRLRKPSLE
jgi:thiamine-phosphate pyrophosphorylase